MGLFDLGWREVRERRIVGRIRSLVAGGTCGCGGHVHPVAAIGRGRVQTVVAFGAIAQILGIHHRRVVMLAVAESPDGILAAGLDIGPFLAGMNLVDHDLEIDRVAAVGIGRAGVVAGHAILDLNSIPAVQAQFEVALIAGCVVGDIAGFGDRIAVGPEIQKCIGHIAG